MFRLIRPLLLFGPIRRCYHPGSAFEWLSREFFRPEYYHMQALTNLLVSTHDLLHLRWDMSIITTALLLRSVVTLPFYIYSERNYAKVVYVSLDCAKSKKLLEDKIESSVMYQRLDAKTAQRYKRSMIRHVFRETCEKNNCHPLKSAATSLVQFPLWISLTFQLRNVCGFHTASGYGWLPLIPDFTSQGLTMACTSLVLPFSLLIIGLANVEIAHLRRPPPVQSNSVLKSWAYKSTRIVGWMGNLIIFYCSTVVPKALAIYWVTSATHQLFTHLLIMHPKVRQICNIWLLPNEGTEPYRRLLNRTMAEYAVVRRLFGRK